MRIFSLTQLNATYPNDDVCLDKVFQLSFANCICQKFQNDKPFNIFFKTVLRMFQQIKTPMANYHQNPFTVVLHADESIIGDLNTNRHTDKKFKESPGGSLKDEIPVFGHFTLASLLNIKLTVEN